MKTRYISIGKAAESSVSNKKDLDIEVEIQGCPGLGTKVYLDLQLFSLMLCLCWKEQKQSIFNGSF